MKNFGKFLKETDLWMMLFCMLTSVFGIMSVFSATIHDLEKGEFISRDAIVMIIAVAVGIIACLFISAIDYEVILKLWPIVIGVSGLLMVLLFFVGTGPPERPDVKTWIEIPYIGIYFQPSELLKIAFIISLSVHLELIQGETDKILNILLLGVHGAIPILLVVLTGDMGSALVFIVMFVVMMFMAGIKLRYFAVAFLTVVAAMPIVWIKVFNDIQRNRFLAIINPEAYPDIIYQQLRCKNAIGSGGWLGQGFLQGSYTQNGAVPEAQTDFILSVVGEEFGFLGCIALMLLLLFILLRTIKSARMANDNPGKMICIGVASMIGAQILINVGMCLMLLPCIGITLPFMSAGGSSNLCIYIAIGLVLSVYRSNLDSGAVDFRMINVRTPYI